MVQWRKVGSSEGQALEDVLAGVKDGQIARITCGGLQTSGSGRQFKVVEVEVAEDDGERKGQLLLPFPESPAPRGEAAMR